MKSVLAAAAVVALAVLSQTVNAANAWKSSLSISSILNNLDGGFLLLLPAGDPACGPSGDHFNVDPSINGQTADSVKTTLALVLTAYATGKTINIYADDTLPGCPVQLVQVNP